MSPKLSFLKQFSLLMATFAALCLCARSSPADVLVYQPYYRPYALYSPLGMWPPSGAALGPWRWNFNVGGGPTAVLGNARNQLTNGWNFTIGSGFNFTPRAGFILEFSNSGLGLTDSTLVDNQASDGNASIWSVTINPIWRFRLGGPVGGYLIGGGGFYERDLGFTESGQIFVPTFDGGFYTPGTFVDHQIDDAGGMNVGAGLTCNLGWGTKIFIEARYHYIFTPGNATQLLPVTIGLRW